jgi:hypothetical protein
MCDHDVSNRDDFWWNVEFSMIIDVEQKEIVAESKVQEQNENECVK